jgi:hypothetical protein
MKISKALKKHLITEILFALGQMKAKENPVEKIFFFSAVYGEMFRILNMEYDQELCLLHQVCQGAYQAINTRLIALATRQDPGITFMPDFFGQLEKSLEELTVNIDEDKDIYSSILKIVNLSYSTTGNGYYLYLKGMLKL